jgi:hypothetical protein
MREAKTSRRTLWTGRVMSGSVGMFPSFDGMAKMLRNAHVLQASSRLGYPDQTARSPGLASSCSSARCAISIRCPATLRRTRRSA